MTKEVFMDKFGEKLQLLLEECDMSQRELANNIGVSKQTISAYICGTRMPSIENVVNIAYVLGCKLTDLIDGDEMIYI